MRAECFSQWSCLLRYLIPSGGFNHFHQFFMFTVVWRRFPCSTHFSHLLKSPVIVGMSWPGRKTLLGKGGKKCRYTKELDYRAPNSWVPNSNCNGFWPKMLCLGFDGFGAPRWKDRNPWKIGKSANLMLWKTLKLQILLRWCLRSPLATWWRCALRWCAHLVREPMAGIVVMDLQKVLCKGISPDLMNLVSSESSGAWFSRESKALNSKNAMDMWYDLEHSSSWSDWVLCTVHQRHLPTRFGHWPRYHGHGQTQLASPRHRGELFRDSFLRSLLGCCGLQGRVMVKNLTWMVLQMCETHSFHIWIQITSEPFVEHWCSIGPWAFAWCLRFNTDARRCFRLPCATTSRVICKSVSWFGLGSCGLSRKCPAFAWICLASASATLNSPEQESKNIFKMFWPNKKSDASLHDANVLFWALLGTWYRESSFKKHQLSILKYK